MVIFPMSPSRSETGLKQTSPHLRIQRRAEEHLRELEGEPAPSSALGWTCSYTPQELIMAAGYTPVRLPTARAPGASPTQSYLPANLCPYVHRLLSTGLSGTHPPWEGVVLAASCDPMRRLADIWDLYLEPGFVYRLDVPRRKDRFALDYFLQVLQDMRLRLQDLTARQISRQDLCRAASVQNRTRRIMRELARLRAMPRPAISGAQFQRFALCADSMDRERFNQVGASFLARIRKDLAQERAGLPRARRPRVLLTGCLSEDSGLPALIEEAGAGVAADNLCSGMRQFQGQVDENAGDPLEAIARRYLRELNCPRMVGREDRVRDLVSLARRAGCDGVVLHTLTFCDLHQMDLPAQQQGLREAGIPCLHLEREHLSGEDSGQLRTRVQAFVELLRGRG